MFLFDYSYIGTSYLLASTVFLPLFASIADIYGRHFGLQLSLVFFLIGSAISTGAVNMVMVLVGRGIAGIGAAGLLTVSVLLFCGEGADADHRLDRPHNLVRFIFTGYK